MRGPWRPKAERWRGLRRRPSRAETPEPSVSSFSIPSQVDRTRCGGGHRQPDPCRKAAAPSHHRFFLKDMPFSPILSKRPTGGTTLSCVTALRPAGPPISGAGSPAPPIGAGFRPRSPRSGDRPKPPTGQPFGETVVSNSCRFALNSDRATDERPPSPPSGTAGRSGDEPRGVGPMSSDRQPRTGISRLTKTLAGPVCEWPGRRAGGSATPTQCGLIAAGRMPNRSFFHGLTERLRFSCKSSG